MPLHYEIETDGLYLEGIEKGIEQGIEQGIEKGATETVRNLIIRLLQLGEFSIEKIALIAGVDIAYVNEIKRTFPDPAGESK